MTNKEVFELLKKNNLISYTEHFKKYIVKRVDKTIVFLKSVIDELPDDYDSYDELLYCIINNDEPKNHICEYCHEKGKFISATRGYKGCGNTSCKNQKTINTNVEKYGTKNPAQVESIKNKIKITNLKRYGNEYGLSNKEIIEKRKKTCIEKYGVDNVWKAKEIQDKIKQTNLNRYNTNVAAKNEKIKNKMKNTCLERYNSTSPLGSQEIRDKAKETFIDKYGVDNYTKSQEYKDRIKVYWDNITEEKLKEWKDKQKQTCLNKYGVEHYTQTHEYHKSHRCNYFYDGLYFDSSWELYFYIYCKEKGFNIIKNPCKFEYAENSIIHYYIPDFEVNGQLIEIKGDHFFDKNNNLINPFDRSQDNVYKAKHKCMLEHNVSILKYSEMKEIIDFVIDKYTNDFVHLFKLDLPFPYINKNLKDKSDLGLIHHFHKSIYEANVKDHFSPIEAWKDKEIIRKVALNRLKYLGSCKPSDILGGFSITKIAPKVSVFSHVLAKRLIETYLNDCNEVFDPFSGFSGRMLGCVSLNKKYIGQDINIKHVEESNKIIKFKNCENIASIKVQDILTDSNNKYECLFTCPPYYDKESWDKNDVKNTCDEWIQICLDKYDCKKYLFVIDKTEKFKDYIVEELVHKSHMTVSKECVILINKP